jgi:CheY-like chemotaxis protein
MSGRVLVVDDSATVRKIVRLVLEEGGYEVRDAADGQQALELLQREVFDLALVDFVMPRLNGYQLAQAVRSIAQLRALPLVLMSARADQIGERFMRQTRAVDAITKPFSPEALLAVVAHAMGRRPSLEPEPTLVREELQSHPSIEPPPPTPSVPPPGRPDDFAPEATVFDSPAMKPTAPDLEGVVPKVLAQAAAAQRFAEVLARALAPAVERAAREGEQPGEKALVEVLTRALAPGDLASLARELHAFEPALRGPIALEGDLARVPLGEVLQLLRLQRQTGLFVVERKSAEVVVALRDGHIDLALARGVSSEFLLGRYVLADGHMTRDELERVLRTRGPASGWLGEHLVRSGRISAADLERVLTRQTSEIVYEVLRWHEGRFRFEHGVALPEAQSARLSLPVESLVLEGFRRVDEWRMIEQEVRSFDEVLARDEGVIDAVGAARLAHEERLVLDAVDGRRTVREIVSAVSMNSFDACKILYRLLRSKLLRRRPA